MGDYGLELAGMETVFQCEINDYCQKILKLRWPHVPKWRDIKTLEAEQIPKCDIITGGFPCQPFSIAGKQRGKEDDRNLWPEMFRIIKQVKPTWILGENVLGIIKYGIDEVLHDLEAEDYATLPLVFPAHAVGADHKRDRVWILGYADSVRKQQPEGNIKKKRGRISNPGENVADSSSQGLQKSTRKKFKDVSRKEKTSSRSKSFRGVSAPWTHWSVEPPVGRVAHGIANRVDRLKLLGNGQVIQAVQWIAERIIYFDQCKNKSE